MLEVQELQQGRRDSEREILIVITESVLNRDFCGLNNIVRIVIGGVICVRLTKDSFMVIFVQSLEGKHI